MNNATDSNMPRIRLKNSSASSRHLVCPSGLINCKQQSGNNPHSSSTSHPAINKLTPTRPVSPTRVATTYITQFATCVRLEWCNNHHRQPPGGTQSYSEQNDDFIARVAVIVPHPTSLHLRVPLRSNLSRVRKRLALANKSIHDGPGKKLTQVLVAHPWRMFGDGSKSQLCLSIQLVNS